MAKVFVVSDAGHDYSSARDRGEITFLTEGKVNVFASDKLVKDIRYQLAGATEHDYLILSGNQFAAAIAYAVLMELTGVVNTLIYSFNKQEYEVRSVRLAAVAGREG